jgi:hypothetical protein
MRIASSATKYSGHDIERHEAECRDQPEHHENRKFHCSDRLAEKEQRHPGKRGDPNAIVRAVPRVAKKLFNRLPSSSTPESDLNGEHFQRFERVASRWSSQPTHTDNYVTPAYNLKSPIRKLAARTGADWRPGRRMLDRFPYRRSGSKRPLSPR